MTALQNHCSRYAGLAEVYATDRDGTPKSLISPAQLKDRDEMRVPLVSLLGSQYAEVRQAGARAVGMCYKATSDSRVVAPLFEALGKFASDRDEILPALSEITGLGAGWNAKKWNEWWKKARAGR